MSNSETQMTEEIVEEWAEATSRAYNDSLTGLDLARVPAAVEAFIDLYGQSKTLTFNADFSPVDYFEEHPATAIASILDSRDALELLDGDQEEALEDILEFTEAWAQFDDNQQPDLGVSEADDDDEMPEW
ncbi:hypothetical protein [Paeniglutamicibacter kerguelensis]|uniref:Uncharacterized protein n=1 Tax=Paeniglutamicibacter kerguelensis TaxID=254788 RepID=A0ABS4XJU0_9MICC|nr:hypothetical protein [Paeniglutamicibacter kerguelensis]MBP2388732.1 hypothetical protein [Paeniglutamicibacter kerguelensis]